MNCNRKTAQNALKMVLWLGYVAALFWILSRHENWRDEAQAWLLARDLSPVELFRQMAYEGHPCLWHLLLMPLTRLGLPYGSMNILSLALTAFAAALLLWKSPFPLWVRVLCLLGTPFLYWFPIVSRSYSLIPPILFLNAMAYPNRRGKPLRYGLTIALLVQTHVIMLGMAGAMSMIWLGEALAAYRKDRDGRMLGRQACGLCLPLLSLLLLLAQLMGVTASSAYTPLNTSVGGAVVLFFRRTFVLAQALFAMARGIPFAVPCAILLGVGLAGVILAPIVARNGGVVKPVAIALAGVAAQLVILVLIYSVISRQRIATCLLILIWTLWTAWPAVRTRGYRVAVTGLTACLCLLAVAMNLQVPLSDLRGPYSSGKDCAEYIRAALPEDALIFQMDDAVAVSVTAYLDGDGMYSIQTGERMTYNTWKDTPRAIPDYATLCERAREIDADCAEVWLLATEREDPADGALLPPSGEAECVYASPTVTSNTLENYQIWRIPIL